MENSQTLKSNLARGYPIALASAIFLSTTAILIRHLTVTYALPAMVLAFWRAVFVTATLWAFFSAFRRPLLHVEKRHWPYLLIYGFVLAVFNSLWTISVAENGAAVATVLVYCSAAFTALLGWWLLKERLDGIKLLVVVLSLAGCVLAAEALDPAIWHMNWYGILTGVLAGLLYAIYTLMGRSASQRGLNSWSALLYIFGVASLFLLLFNLFFGQAIPGGAKQAVDLLWLGNAWAGWGVLFVLAAVPTVAGFGLYNLSLVYLPSSVTNLIVTSEPVFTSVFAYFLLGEQLNQDQLSGAVLILAGVVILRIHEGRVARTAQPVSAEI